MKLFPADGWYVVLALRQRPHVLVLPLVFWGLVGETLRGIMADLPWMPEGERVGEGLCWADIATDQALFVGYYHAQRTPKEQIHALVQEAIARGVALGQ